MRFSYSRVECFNNCPYQFKLRYLDKLKTIPNWDDPANALIVGTAMHHGIEKGVEEAVNEYLMSYPIITDAHENEVIKLKAMIPKVLSILPEGGEFEKTIQDEDKFIGFIDWTDGETILDFKYSNNVEKYKKSPQIHVYKYYSDKLFGTDIKRLGYLIIPKTLIRQKKTETLEEFRKRLKEQLSSLEPYIEWVEFDKRKVDEFLVQFDEIENTKNFEKNQTRFCDWCDYKIFCLEGNENMLLPKINEDVDKTIYHNIYIYGLPFSGKTTLASKFPKPLMLNTDGNAKRLRNAGVISIRDEVITSGRVTKPKTAWEIFKEIVQELKKGSEYETVVVDLIEDIYEYCRKYVCSELRIDHESEGAYGKAWDKVKDEFFTVIKDLTSMDYNVILISHEDSSKELTKSSGAKFTSIRPNINEKIALKLAGRCEIVIRCVVVEDGVHKLSFKTDEVTFGGSRIEGFNVQEIPNDYNSLTKVLNATYTGQAENGQETEEVTTSEIEKAPEESKTEVPTQEETNSEAQVNNNTPSGRKRRVR